MKQIIIKNQRNQQTILSELGVIINALGTASLNWEDIIDIGNNQQLIDEINSGTIVINDGTNDLSTAQAIDYLRLKEDLSNYYTRNEVDSIASQKATTNHAHDDLYYRKPDVDSLISNSGSYGIVGSVETYDNLPDSGMNEGDIYIVRETTGINPQNWLNNWSNRFQIKISKDHIHGDLTDFPVYLNFNNVSEDHPFWAKVKSNGADIRITDSNNNQVPLEIVSFNSGDYIQGLHLYEFHNINDPPNNHDEFIAITSGQPSYAQDYNSRIDGEETTPGGAQDNFVLMFSGYIYAPTTGVYTFATDSDDGSEIEIDGQVAVSWYGAHSNEDNWDHNADIMLTKGYHRFIYRQEERNGGAVWRAGWRIPGEDDIDYIPASAFYRSINTGEIWFKVALKPGQDNSFYLYYGNAQAAALSPSETYGRNAVWSNYELVMHFQEAISSSSYNIIDSTGKHGGLHYNTDPTSQNLIGKSLEYDGHNDYSEITNMVTDSSWTELTVTSWVYKDSSWDNDQRFIDMSHGHNLRDNEFVLMVERNRNLEFRVNSNTSYHQFSFMEDLNEHQWTKITGTWSGIDKVAKVFKNGDKEREFTFSNGDHIKASSDHLRIGDAPQGNQEFSGNLDEVRISKIALSEQWEKTEYDNIVYNSSFYTIGDEENEFTANQQNYAIPGTYTPTSNTFVFMKFNGDSLNQIGPYQPSVHSTPEYGPGLSGQCAVLNTDDYYYFNSNPFFGEGNELSVGVFVYFESFQTYDTLIERYQAGADGGYRFGLHDGRIELELGGPSHFLRLKSPTQIPLNQWVHIGFTYDGNSGITKIYRDATVVNSSSQMSGNIDSSGKTLYINWDSSYNRGSNVKLEDLFATNDVLYEEDFQSIVYNQVIEEYNSEGFYRWNGSNWEFLSPNTSGSAVQHNSLQGLNEGDLKHLTSNEYSSLTGGNDTNLHSHDDRYYLKSETDSLLDEKSDTGHTHSEYYTKSEVDNVTNNLTYSSISANDPDTNVTSQELERLTNGSNADGLHTHDFSGIGGGGSLEDAYNNNSQYSPGAGREIHVDHGPVDLQASGGFAPLRLAGIDYVPNQLLNTGCLCVYDGELFLYDATRNCWCSVSGHYIGGGFNGNNIRNTYLRGYNGTSFTDDVGWVAPWDGIVVSMAASSNSETSQAIELRKNGNSTSAKVWYNHNKKTWSNMINVRFNEGDVLNFYATENANGCNRPQVWAIIKRRI